MSKYKDVVSILFMLVVLLCLVTSCATNQLVEIPTETPPSPIDSQLKFEIGDIGPAGGYVFYDKGSYSEGWRYLEASPKDWFNGSEEPRASWDKDIKKSIKVTEAAIGAGMENTLAIIQKLGLSNNAASICFNLVIENNGIAYNDWYLPSKEELYQMHENHLFIEGFISSEAYWSSTEEDRFLAWIQVYTGGKYTLKKTNSKNFRPNRSF